MSSNFRAANALSSNVDGAGVRVGLVCGRWNDHITNRLIEGAENALAVHGVAEADVIQVWVPGAYEAPMAAIGLIDSGKVDVASSDKVAAAKCIAMIREITAEAEIGKLYVGVVKRITDFGAFVEIFPGTDGLVHISHLAKERVNKVTDVVNEGDEVLVRVIDIDKMGKIRLSRKEALEES